MSQINSRQLNTHQKKSTLNHILWFIENYLPQKKNRASRKELHLANLEAEAIRLIKEFAFLRSKSLKEDFSQKKVTFTIGSWALPFLKTLKRTGILK